MIDDRVIFERMGAEIHNLNLGFVACIVLGISGKKFAPPFFNLFSYVKCNTVIY
jgi:hypothetical protein